jgi:DNA-binding IclR family transcriptional regulator
MDSIAQPAALVGSDRVLAVLAELARHPAGVALDDLARILGSPKSSIHRALGALRRAELAAQDGRGHYLLGDEFLRMAFAHHEARPDHMRIAPVLEALAARYGETAHYAVLDGDEVVYRAKVDPAAGAVKLTSVVGGRNPAHATAVGKLLLAYALPDDQAVHDWVGGRVLARPTERTIVDAGLLAAELGRIRRLGYAVDDRENEEPVNCVAVPVSLGTSTAPSGAVSVSGLAYRTPLRSLVEDIDAIRAIALRTEAASE